MPKPFPRRKRSFLHEEFSLTAPHILYATVGAVTALLLVVATAVLASSATSPSISQQISALNNEVTAIQQKLANLEVRLDKLDGGGETAPVTLGPIPSCESLTAALPTKTEWTDNVTNLTCANESIVGYPQKKFLTVSGKYQYAENSEILQDITVQIYDLSDDSASRTVFLTQSAFEATDFNLVKRVTSTINEMNGVFTYEGSPVRSTNYSQGANWFIYKDRFAILVHGVSGRLADKTKLDDLVSKMDLDALAAIQ